MSTTYRLPYAPFAASTSTGLNGQTFQAVKTLDGTTFHYIDGNLLNVSHPPATHQIRLVNDGKNKHGKWIDAFQMPDFTTSKIWVTTHSADNARLGIAGNHAIPHSDVEKFRKKKSMSAKPRKSHWAQAGTKIRMGMMMERYLTFEGTITGYDEYGQARVTIEKIISDPNAKIGEGSMIKVTKRALAMNAQPMENENVNCELQI